MKLRLVVAPLAQRDIAEIADYIAADKPRAALRMIDRIERAVHLLQKRPFMGPPVIFPDRPGLRKSTVVPCIIFYRVTASELQIVRILHASRDLDVALGPI